MRGSAIWGLLMLVECCVVLADPEADPSEELFNRLPKNRNEDKCYDENSKPQVRLNCLYACCIMQRIIIYTLKKKTEQITVFNITNIVKNNVFYKCAFIFSHKIIS